MPNLPRIVGTVFVSFVFMGATASADSTKSVNVLSVQILSSEQGSRAIRGPEDDSFFINLRRSEAAAMTGVAMGEKTLAECRSLARDFFGAAVLDFSQEEATTLRQQVQALAQQFGDQYPRLIRRPWKLIKTRRDLCGGFSFTRGDCIILNERTVAGMLRAFASEDRDDHRRYHGLLLHEQMHVLQRLQPELFRPLYEDVFGFHKAKVQIHEWIDRRQVSNPDGTDENWVLQVERGDTAEPQRYWIGTLLLADKPIHTMGRDFSGVAVKLEATTDGYQMVTTEDGVPVYRPLHEFGELTSRFPIRGGYDHPNEVAAYLFADVITNPKAKTVTAEKAAEILDKSRDWFLKHLSLGE